jgi:hypothetical protein
MRRDHVREQALWYIPMSRKFTARWIRWRRRSLGVVRLRDALGQLLVEYVVTIFEVNLGLGEWEEHISTHLPQGRKFLESERDLWAEVEFVR